MGKIYVVGLGPGGENQMTPRAKEAIACCDIVAGYGVYMDLIAPLLAGKEQIVTPMKGEIERCRLAVEAAADGHTVAVVSSGDAGVYGMAAPVLALAAAYPEISVEVVPGITASTAAAAILGAPLTHDFATISLSDLLTPIETIEQRVRAAAQADFVICLYNPSSRKRADYLRRACTWILDVRSGETPCGYVRNAGREGECYGYCTLRELMDFQADMFTTVLIGN
ncbi:MAG TPA: precorrin-3B C(17)-methyltransferase, partial [Firmicutes bacterium]|nr:precorrin-3B C(17)-methyltransferase [Bacillota bacterium]